MYAALKIMFTVCTLRLRPIQHPTNHNQKSLPLQSKTKNFTTPTKFFNQTTKQSTNSEK